MIDKYCVLFAIEIKLDKYIMSRKAITVLTASTWYWACAYIQVLVLGKGLCV